MRKEVIIGLTYGDPAGIGPEILSKFFSRCKSKFKPLVIGAEKYLKDIKCKNISYIVPSNLIKNGIPNKFILPGRPSLYSAIHAYECLKYSVSLALDKKIKALIFSKKKGSRLLTIR